MGQTEFEALVAWVQACRRCPAMEGRRRVLSAHNGRPSARIMFIAEAPGRRGAERTGIPMTGDLAGRRFTRMLALSGLDRDDVFITNAALCNPRTERGTNRAPSRAELAACAGWLEAQLAVVAAPVIATLGAVSLAALARIAPHGAALRTHVAMPVPWQGRTLVPLYHPSPRAGLARPYAEQDEDFRRLGEIVARCTPTGGLLP